MAFIEIPKSTRGPRSCSKTASNITIVKSGREGDAMALQLTIGADVMSRMRWLIGDGVSVAFDDADPLLVLVKRVQKDGRTISSPGGRADHGSAGMRGLVKFGVPKNLPFKWKDAFYCESPVEAHGGVVFQFKAE